MKHTKNGFNYISNYFCRSFRKIKTMKAKFLKLELGVGQHNGINNFKNILFKKQIK